MENIENIGSKQRFMLSKEESVFDKIIDRTHTNCAKYDEMNRRYGGDVIHCAVADMDFEAPEEIRNAFQKVLEHGVFGYTNLPEDYRHWVKEWIHNRYHCKVEEEWILFSPRINIGLNMAVETFTEPCDKIIVHTPAYPALTDAVLKYGRVLVESPLKLEKESGTTKWRMDFDSLESRMDGSEKMMLLCSPHNPVGRVWDMDELKGVEAFCLRHDLLLLVDEIHGDIIRNNQIFYSALLLSDEMKKRLIVYQSITKTFNVPGIIFSNMIIPDREIRMAMQKTIDRWGFHNPNVFAAALIEPAYTKCISWLKEMNCYLDRNLEYIADFIRDKMPELKMSIPEGTYLVWINYSELGMNDQEIQEFFIKKAKVSVYGGEHFGEAGKGYIRLNAAVPWCKLDIILHRILKAYEK